MVDQTPTTVQEIFRDSVLSVPAYQRDYSWKRQHVRDLLRDIKYLYSENQRREDTEKHYFGTIVLHHDGIVEVGSDRFDKYQVVDGQQRLATISLIIGLFIESIEELEISPANLHSDEHPPERLSRDLEEDYIKDRGHRRLELHTADQGTFNSLVVDQTDPAEVETEGASSRHLIMAKSEIQSWLEEFNTGSDIEFYRTILDIKRIINNYFQLTKYEVDSVGEAGRIFETLNDRGRSLSVTDKIKSYLVYCAHRMEDEALAEQIYIDFGDVIRNITSDGTEAELTRFMKEHWRMFSGEIRFANSSAYEINDLHRRIKDVDHHAKIERENSDLRDWIEAYLESLVESSEAYKLVAHPENIVADGSSRPKSEIKRNLKNIYRHTSRRNVSSLMVATKLEFGFSQEFEQITELLEKFVWRAYQVCRAHRDYGRNEFRKFAHRLYYQGNPGDPAAIFDKDAEEIDVFVDVQDAFEKICYRIEDLIGHYGSDQQFEVNLRRNDVFNGNINEVGWNGFRDRDKVIYFLYEYEYYLRSSSSPPLQRPLLEDWESEGVDSEYLWPDDPDLIPDELETEFRMSKDSFGNLALRHPDSPTDPDSSEPYDVKYREIYAESPLEMMGKLPDSDWGPGNIQERLDELVTFANERWGIDTRVIVPADIEDEDLRDKVRSQISDQFDSNDEAVPGTLNHIPGFEFNEENSPSEDDVVYGCDHCGDVEFTIEESGERTNYICICGATIDYPSFFIRLSDFSVDTE